MTRLKTEKLRTAKFERDAYKKIIENNSEVACIRISELVRENEILATKLKVAEERVKELFAKK